MNVDIIRNCTCFHVLKNVRKKDIYNTMIKLAIENGWKDLSSVAADGNVLYSKGSDEKQEIYLQMRPAYNGSTSYDIQTTSYRYYGMRPLTKYTPGTSGKAGVPVPSTEPWQYIVTCDRDVSGDFQYNLYYSITKDRIIFIFEDKYLKTAYYTYMGKPNPTYNKSYKDTGIICHHSNGYSAGAVNVHGIADTLYQTAVAGVLFSHKFESPKDTKGRIMLSELGFASTEGGFIGYFDGVYGLGKNYKGAYQQTEDYIYMGEYTYRIFKMGNTPVNSYNPVHSFMPFIAIRLEKEGDEQ